MRVPVPAVCLVVGLSLLTSIAPAQTKNRVAKKREPAAPSSVTTKICQGVPIPDGYIVIGYVSSTACPHGAYVLKKQNANGQESQSLSRMGADNSATNENAAQSSATTTTTSGARPRRVGAAKSSTRPSTGAARIISDPVSTNVVGGTSNTTADPGPPTLTGGPVVAKADPRPPSLTGGSSAAPTDSRPPTLSGATPVGDQVGASANAANASGPEEVGEGDVVRVDTTLVTVPVSVLDRQGRFVPNLRREDFSIFENGVEQPIAYFEPAEKPFTVALVLDTSASTHFHLWEIKEAAINFAKQMRSQDRVLVVTFNDEVMLLTEATNDMGVITTVIEENVYTGSATRLYDAVDLVVKERLNNIKGRKAIVLFTDGVDTASRIATYAGTLREAEELDALIYPIQYDTTDYMRAMQTAGTVTVVTTRGNWPFPGSSSSQQTYQVPINGGVPMPGTTKADYDRADRYLHQLAEKSGGRLYEANDSTQLAKAFSQIAEELRRQYSLGYYPKGAVNGERHQIRVKVRQPDLAVKARDTYVQKSAPPK
jgi:VWFA-related protein